MISPVVDIIIVNWNGLEHLQTCLPAVAAQTYSSMRVVVVDNGSEDGSVEWIGQHYPETKVLVNDRNLGFAPATNQGIRATEGEYVVILNNDTEPEPMWLEALVRVVESHPSVGMVASQVAFAFQPEILDSTGIEIDVLGIAWNRHLGLPVAEEPTDAVEVFGPAGVAALYRREMLDEIGLFDERYFAYYEDVDLAWRARRAGWRCLYAPGARVYHVHSATGMRLSGFKAYHLGRNKWWTLFKNYPLSRLWPWIPLLLLVDGLAWLWPLLRRGDSAGLCGRVRAWRSVRTLWRAGDGGEKVSLAPFSIHRLVDHRELRRW